MINTALRLLKIQFFLIIPTFFVAFFFQICIMPCYSLVYGATLVLLNSALALVASKLAEVLANNSVKYALALMFLAAGVRFAIIGACLALGLAILDLSPAPMLSAFIGLLLISQLINIVMMKFSNNNGRGRINNG